MKNKTYIFHRKEGWYPVELPDDKTALDCVPINPGTIKIERMNEDGSSEVVYTCN
jgi:hypothetical protein